MRFEYTPAALTASELSLVCAGTHCTWGAYYDVDADFYVTQDGPLPLYLDSLKSVQIQSVEYSVDRWLVRWYDGVPWAS